MICLVKKVGVALLVAIAVVLTGGVALYFAMDAEFTECYGVFESRDAAERAADTAGDGDLDADVHHRASESAVTFQSDETGDDAREARRTFREIVKRESGILGHPGGGCTERKAFN